MRTAPSATPRRARTSAVRYAEIDKVHRQVTELVRTRWPGLDSDHVSWRVLARFARELEADRRPAQLPAWVRRITYQLVVDDQRADRGEDAHQRELNMLLRELARAKPHRIAPALLERCIIHLHPHDRAVLRLVLAGHQRAAVAARTGLSPAQVDLAYSRARVRLRAAIETEAELREALRRAADEATSLTMRLAAARAAARRPRGSRAPRGLAALGIGAA